MQQCLHGVTQRTMEMSLNGVTVKKYGKIVFCNFTKVKIPTHKTGLGYVKGLNLSLEVMIFVILM